MTIQTETRTARPPGRVAVAPETRTLKVVAVTWRDMAHPSAGGAEVLMDRMLHELADRGHDITMVCGGPTSEHPFRVVDVGGTYSQYLRAPLICARRFRRADVVIDVQNGMPFFSPLWRRRPSVCLVHHVHTDQWETRFPPVVAKVMRGVEGRLMPLVYRNRRFVAISQSTARALRDLGVDRHAITVIESGVDVRTDPSPPKAEEPLLLSLNRLVPHKRIDLMLEAWRQASTRIPGTLVVAGDGPLLADLREQARGIPRVEVVGRVDDETKEALLGRAWAVLSTAHHEGWGMSMLEAAAFGTPALAVDAPGIRDAVVDGVTGRLVHVHDEAALPDALAQAMVAFVEDETARRRFGSAARRRAEELSWDRSTERWEQVLVDVAAGVSPDQRTEVTTA